jgi:predicted acyl esterase
VLDWCCAQPWCSGRVALFGQSYDACAALHTASAAHPSVTSVVAINPFLDMFTAISAPGGVPQRQFVAHWAGIVRAFDTQRVDRLPGHGLGMHALARGVARALPAEELPHGGAAGVSGGGGAARASWGARRAARGRRRALLAQAVAQHGANWDPRADGAAVACIDDVAPSAGVSSEEASVCRVLDQLSASRVPVYWTSAWFDATASSACAGFAATRDAPGTELLIGPWTHMLWQQVVTSGGGGGGGAHGHLSAFSMPHETLRFMLARFAAAEATGSPRASTTSASLAAFEAAAAAAALAEAAAKLAPASVAEEDAHAVPVSPQPAQPPSPLATPPSPPPAAPAAPRVRFFEMGTGRWVLRPDWPPVPPAAAAAATYSLQRGALAPSAPMGFEDSPAAAPPLASGRDALRVRTDARPSGWSRWQAMLTIGRMVRYDMRRLPLRYEAPPLAAPLRVAGAPVVTLWLDSSDGRGDIFAYVLDVDPSGKAHYVTEGCFRAAHRAEPAEGPAALGARAGTLLPQHAPRVPCHTFRRADAAPLPAPAAAAPARVCFALLPTSYVFAARHRVALALSGADAKHFASEEGTEARTLGVSWGADTPSQLALPLLRDGEATHRGGHRERAGDEDESSSNEDASGKGGDAAASLAAAKAS